MKLSVAIPLYNEHENFPELLRRVDTILAEVPDGPHELVLVDDGSHDNTASLCRSAVLGNAEVVVVQLSRNFGHQAALTAAMDHCHGDAVMFLDGDLQDPPEIIPQFLERLREGYDVVFANRIGRKEGVLLRFSYFLFYRIVRALADIDLPIDSGDCAIVSRRALNAIRSLPERQRYLRGLRAWVGFRQTSIEVKRAERFSGEPKYTFRKLIGLALDGLFSFTQAPLRAIFLIGVTVISAASLYVGYAIYERLFYGTSPQGFTALILSIVFLAGVQLLFLGVIGEYLWRIHDEVKRRPTYLVSEVFHRSAASKGKS